MKRSGPSSERPAHDREENERFFRQVNVAFLVHELKEPVAVIEAGVRALLEKQGKFGALTGRQQKTLQRALRNAQKTRTMLADLLEIGRAEENCFRCEPFSPVTITEQVVMTCLESERPDLYDQAAAIADAVGRQALLARHGIVLDMAPDSAAVHIELDEVKFGQMVANLVRNALRYSRQQMAVRLFCPPAGVVLEVRDDGPGIDERLHEAIFERFKQAQPARGLERCGHGLGLAGARIIARCLGGDITVHSQAGRGATFRLILPRSIDADCGCAMD